MTIYIIKHSDYLPNVHDRLDDRSGGVRGDCVGDRGDLGEQDKALGEAPGNRPACRSAPHGVPEPDAAEPASWSGRMVPVEEAPLGTASRLPLARDAELSLSEELVPRSGGLPVLVPVYDAESASLH